MTDATTDYSKLQKTLEESAELKSKLEAELDASKKECSRVKHQLNSVNTEIQDMKVSTGQESVVYSAY